MMSRPAWINLIVAISWLATFETQFAIYEHLSPDLTLILNFCPLTVFTDILTILYDFYAVISNDYLFIIKIDNNQRNTQRIIKFRQTRVFTLQECQIFKHPLYLDMFKIPNVLLITLLIIFAASLKYQIIVAQRDAKPILSYLVQKNSVYKQVFNPTWMPASAGTNQKKGLIIRTQDCEYKQQGCVFCGGSAQKASIMTFSQQVNNEFTPITAQSIVFTPFNFSDSWGTEDPRMVYNQNDQFYYMMYTAYNGSSILLNLARSKNPTDRNSWERLGPVFPNYQNSKSGALLIRNQPPHYLFWGDSDIRVTMSNDISKWDSIGTIFLSPRVDHFDSRLVESGPPPLLLSNGDYLFIYNSAQKGWPQDPKTAYHVGWVILDGKDPTIIKQRSQVPLMGPQYDWEKGQAPYFCNVPNVVFLQAAQPLGNDRFRVYFGGGDATVGSAIIQVKISNNNVSVQQ